MIHHWLDQSPSRRGVNLQVLHEHLVAGHRYTGSYKLVHPWGTLNEAHRRYAQSRLIY